jgi:hypothetical protein
MKVSEMASATAPRQLADPGLVELEMAGGGIGSVLLGSTLERALTGLILGMAMGWLILVVRRMAHRPKIPRLTAPKARAA